MHNRGCRRGILVFIIMGFFFLGLDICFFFEDNGSEPVSQSQPLLSYQLEKVNDIHFSFEKTPIKIDYPVYINTNRFFIPLMNVVDQLHGTWTTSGNLINLELGNQKTELDIKNNTFNCKNKITKLKKKVFNSGGTTYVSLFDFIRMLNLKTAWDSTNNTIYLFRNREAVQPESPVKNPMKPALIRLEDFIAGYRYSTDENLEKMRAVVDFLYNKGIPFSVAWIPRYVDPPRGLDVDVSKQNTFFNADFVYTLDYITEKNGTIGLHGYTHQYGNTRSGSGAEFPGSANFTVPDNAHYVEERLESAIDSAHRLDIPYAFFEAPHYIIKYEYLKMVEKRFDTIYQGNAKNVKKVKNGNHTTWYIGAYLEFIPTEEETDITHLVSRIDNLEDGVLASFFFHASFEFDDIHVTKDSTGYPCYTYSSESPLHQILRTFDEKGFTFVSLEDVKK
ncbi:MAG: hypothetical protein AWM53_00054 [Candidatus Dichloromethanomonas elyunquensis]|nr:MAG: hypothetical protein AWM53_00054 [Candidatus Dichloromethanomonas elyunquensis]